MANHILKCRICGAYTMNVVCSCGGEAVISRPPKYSPDDKYGAYRRSFKHDGLVQKGLL